MIEKQLTGLAAELDALTSVPAAHRGPRCSVGTLLDAADADVAASLRAVLEMTSVSSVSIAETLSRHGDLITAYTVARHRRRGEPNGCRCSR
ncbi:hypothetical protein [Streptomyces sp. NBC_00268]|uniref:hypothetical protein n=1 Tax=Streptomyces sp. NBC_00268 TaxID=2975695 RepID=UPI002252E595|nr:hypothetical protein [Streptomyces sp. NBC_00268]MCX5182646.1 hypothetical protein [Streptomyces sp. NBC_00268]